MSDDELSDAIVELCDSKPFVWMREGGLTLDGDFTPSELLSIVTLLKKEGRV